MFTPTKGATPVAVIVSQGHLWVPVPEGTQAFDQAAPDFAWRASAALTLGYLEAGLSMAANHARTRQQFGRSLDSFQAIAFRLAESRWRLTGLRLIIHEAGWRADRGQRQALPVSALAWVYARRTGRVVAAHLHQIHGAIGFSGELGLTRLTGACALFRTTVAAQPATQAAWAERSELTNEPPSTVFAGFRA
jgi:alkylation response protein AidB-like acyl-CoA dehydrogenase